MLKKLKKLLRFISIYGFSRTINKAIARMRVGNKKIYWKRGRKNISIIGCGQFAFSCISYFLARNKGNVFLDCYDIELKNAKSLGYYYRFRNVVNTPEELVLNKELETLYIASNHATHTTYAIQAMEKGVKSLYLEKPLSTSYEQFLSLINNQRKYEATLYVGYNRPYSQAVKKLQSALGDIKSSNNAFSVNYFISGHLIGDDHWYRNYDEGTRVCGNMGHWLDLSIHILSWRALPETISIQIAYSNINESDDNITVNMTTEKGDLVSIMLTSRTEPFEGINETVNFQYQDTIAKIDDFRKITIWQGDKLMKKRFFPKDVGHKRAVLQPFYNEKENRNWNEVIVSTLLMLHITDMVRSKQKSSDFIIPQVLEKLEKDIAKFNK